MKSTLSTPSRLPLIPLWLFPPWLFLPWFFLPWLPLMPARAQESTLFNAYRTQPEVWRPAAPSEPGVDAKGDLTLSVPVMSVPGRDGFGFEIRFTYRSGIRLLQRASWIGLGWEFDPGSITREPMGLVQGGTVHGTDWPGAAPAYQPDLYFVSLPEGSSTMTRFMSGTLPPRTEADGFYLSPWRPWKIDHAVATPLTVTDASGSPTTTSVLYDNTVTTKPDYASFTLTTESGTRYVFAHPTISTFRTLSANMELADDLQVEYYGSTWRLRAILAEDYSGPDIPLGSEAGRWIRFDYTTPTTVVDINGVEAPTRQQLSYLSAIVTPTHQATFFLSPRYGETFALYEEGLYQQLTRIELAARSAPATIVAKAELTTAKTLTSPLQSRLALTALKRYGKGSDASLPAYAFTYWGACATLLTEAHTDWFGYCNGNPEGDFNLSTIDGRAWSLKRITYPMGGYDEFDYEDDAILSSESVPYWYYDLETGINTAYSFGISSFDTRQGGARLLSHTRADGLGSTWTSTYSYDAGRLSGIPSGWWKNYFTSMRGFLGSERGEAAIYYDALTRSDPDAGSVKTFYTTSGNTAATVFKLQSFLYVKLDAGNPTFTHYDFTLAQGNQHWNWGLPYETRYFNNGGTNPVRTTARTYDLSAYTLGSAFTSGTSQAKIVWGYPEKITSLAETDYGQSASTSTSVTKTTTYTHDTAAGTGTGYVTSLEETLNSSATPARRSEYTYGYQKYSELDTRNILTPVVQILLGEKTSTTSTTWHASSVTRWGAFTTAGGATLWKPKYTLAWNGTASTTKPTFANWTSDTIPAGWQKKDETTAYNEHGLPTSLVDPRGHVTTLTYFTGTTGTSLTPPGLLQSVAKGGLSVEFTYDSSFLLLSSVKDENGASTSYTYDAFGRLSSVQDRLSPSNTVTTYTYATAAAPFKTTVKQFHASGLSYESISYVDGLSRPLQEQVKDGTFYVITHREYLPGTSSGGRKERLWKPYRQASAGAYQSAFASQARTAYGSTTNPYTETLYRRDGLSRVDKVTPPNDGVSAPYVLTAYKVGALDGGSSSNYSFTETTDEGGHIRRTFSDTFGRVKQQVDGYNTAEKAVTTFTYNVQDQPTQIVDPRGLTTTNTYDVQGRLTQRVRPDGGTTKYKYDAAGLLRFQQDAAQAAASDVLYRRYDALGRPYLQGLHTSIDFATLSGTSTYDWETATTDYFLSLTHYGDAANAYGGTAAKPSTASYPWSLFSTQIAAAPAISNGKAHVTATAYKSNGRWQIALQSYDGEERPLWRRLYSEAATGGVASALSTTLTYSYNWQDQVTLLQATLGSQNWYQWFDYEGRGLPAKTYASTTATKPALADLYALYTAAGNPSQIQLKEYAAGFYRDTKAYAYTLRDQVSAIDLDSESTPFAALYTYLADGNVASATFNQGGAASEKRFKYAYSYDALHRLTAADYSYAVWNATGEVGPEPFAIGQWDWYTTSRHDVTGIAYDKSGNITALTRNKETGAAIDQLTYTYTAGTNRLASVSDAITSSEAWDAETGGFTYDGSGNLKTAPAPYSLSAATYDERNLPTSITAAGTTTTYRYAYEGARFAKKVGSAAGEHYVLDGGQVLGVFSDSGTLTHWNILFGGSVWGRYEGSTRRYYHKDALGSTRLVMNESGTTVEWRDYDPFGLTMPSRSYLSGAAAKEGFTGKERDSESGLDYFGARYYMSAIGRWTSVDPLAEEFPEWSPYSYAFDNPVRFVDPNGADPCVYEGKDDADGAYCLPEIVVVAESKYLKPALILDGILATTGVLLANDVTILGIADDALIPVVVVGGAILVGGSILINHISSKPDEQINALPYTPPPKVLPGFPEAKRVKQKTGRARWVDSNGDILEWDSMHAEVEKYDKKGNHKGSFDPETGEQLKPRVPGRETEK
jgi:RHS repeat-associated protein